MEDKFVRVKVVAITDCDSVRLEDGEVQEDFLLKKGFEFRRFWTLDRSKL